MYLRRLKNYASDDCWSIVSLCNDRGDCPTDDFLSGLDANFEKDVNRVRVLFTHIAKNGLNQLSVDVSHNIAPEIFEFIRGRLRIVWFYGDGRRIVVCSHGFLKKGQKTPRSEIETAQRARSSYVAAQQKGAVAIVEEE